MEEKDRMAWLKMMALIRQGSIGGIPAKQIRAVRERRGREHVFMKLQLLCFEIPLRNQFLYLSFWGERRRGSRTDLRWCGDA
jgi:hypothetical protein